MTTTNTNTGLRDDKGRVIWRGPLGGLFVRQNGKKLRPASRHRARAAVGHGAERAHGPDDFVREKKKTGVGKSIAAPSMTTNTGAKDSRGRTIWRGPRGGLHVLVNGRRQHVRGGLQRGPKFANLPPDMHAVIGSFLSNANAAHLAATGRAGRNAASRTLATKKAAWDNVSYAFRRLFTDATHAATLMIQSARSPQKITGDTMWSVTDTGFNDGYRYVEAKRLKGTVIHDVVFNVTIDLLATPDGWYQCNIFVHPDGSRYDSRPYVRITMHQGRSDYFFVSKSAPILDHRLQTRMVRALRDIGLRAL